MRRVRTSIWLMVGTVISCVVLALLPSLRLSSVPTETPAKVRTVYVGRLRDYPLLRRRRVLAATV